MKANKNLKIITFSILLIFTVIVGYLAITFIYQEYALRREIAVLSELDITKDNFDTKLISHGNYLKVEKAIKNYLSDYANNLQNINKLVDDEAFKKIISYESFQSTDAFKEEIRYIEDTKKQFNFYINNLLKMCDEDNIKNNIKNYTSNVYYKNLYNELMLDKSVTSKLNLSVEYLKDYSEKINNKLDNCLELYNFLNTNSESWKVEEGEIKFATDELINTYNSYIEKIK